MSTDQVKTPPARETTFIFRPDSYFERLDPKRLFSRTQPMEVELGSGDGSFLAGWARLHPERNFIGVERLLGRLRKLDRKGRRAGLTNLKLIRIEASYLVEWLLPPGSVRALHIYFPDPWPKRKHRRHRLINGNFASLAARALEIGGVIYLRTDDEDYYSEMRAAFEGNSSYRSVETPVALKAFVTDFERTFQARGVSTLQTAFERV